MGVSPGTAQWESRAGGSERQRRKPASSAVSASVRVALFPVFVKPDTQHLNAFVYSQTQHTTTQILSLSLSLSLCVYVLGLSLGLTG